MASVESLVYKDPQGLDGKLTDAIPDYSWPIDPYATTPEVLRALGQRIRELKPAHIFEAGSGLSTLHLATQSQPKAIITSVEHTPASYHRTMDRLASLGKRVNLQLRNLKLQRFGQAAYWWYDGITLPMPSINFAYIDGPQEQYGRQAALPFLLPHMADKFELWLDDCHRDTEQTILRLWSDVHNVHVDVLTFGTRRVGMVWRG